jgi:peptidyl-prolyl cis-trans isomerase family protein
VNIYEKLQKARVELQSLGLKMGGHNKFADFKYFELKDFLPKVNEIFEKLKLFSKFDLLENEGVLTVINTEKTDETITFVTPKAEIVLKGQNGLQMIGSTHTYLKRYCYLNALEIVEDDVINATIDKDKQQNKSKKYLTEEEKKQRMIKFINENCKDYQKEIDKYMLSNSTDNLAEISYEEIKELATFIKNGVEEKKGA